jgi:hypothetical protein
MSVLEESSYELLNVPNIHALGANTQLMAVFEAVGGDGEPILVGHVYAELIVSKIDGTKIDPVSAAVMSSQLNDNGYNATEWIRVNYRGEVREILAVVNQLTEAPDEGALSFVKRLLNPAEWGWELLKDGTAVEVATGKEYSTEAQNRLTVAYGGITQEMQSEGVYDEEDINMALLLALPVFTSMYVEDVEAVIVELDAIKAIAEEMRGRVDRVMATLDEELAGYVAKEAH